MKALYKTLLQRGILGEANYEECILLQVNTSHILAEREGKEEAKKHYESYGWRFYGTFFLTEVNRLEEGFIVL